MNRKQRAGIAKETLAIIESGRYTSADGKQVRIAGEIKRCIAETRHYAPDDFDEVEDRCAKVLKERSCDTKISVINSTTFAAAYDLTIQGSESEPDGLPNANVMSLNFASAKNPGGGFLGGSQAQEECLARASALYGSINPQQGYYNSNRNCGTPLYTDHLIYSPAVPVFRDDDDRLLDQPWCTSIVTSPAVNRGAIEKGNQSDLHKVAATMRQRISNVLSVAVVHQCRRPGDDGRMVRRIFNA